jgi:hypothetical protein
MCQAQPSTSPEGVTSARWGVPGSILDVVNARNYSKIADFEQMDCAPTGLVSLTESRRDATLQRHLYAIPILSSSAVEMDSL